MDSKKIIVAISTYRDRINNAINISQQIPDNDVLIIHQAEKPSSVLMPKNVKYVHSNIYGISNSRNLALKNSKEGILLFADDDVTYLNNFKKIIADAFDHETSPDICIFKIQGREEKSVPKYRIPHSFTRLKASSIGIAVHVPSIKKTDINFNPLFGIGGKFVSGEEHIFLHDAKKKGLKILLVNQAIVSHPHESSGQNLSYKQFKAKVAAFKKTHGSMGIIVSVLYFTYKIFVNKINDRSKKFFI